VLRKAATFTPDDDWVSITFDWWLRAEKPLLRYLSFIFKLVFLCQSPMGNGKRRRRVAERVGCKE
jgi:hypothetical protein